MTDWIEAYRETADRNEKYRLLRAELSRLRAAAHEADESPVPDAGDVAATIEGLADRVDGHLLVFAANDFGFPAAFRPREVDRAVQDRVRRAILDRKYDRQDDLDGIRRDLLDAYPGLHKAVVAAVDGGAEGTDAVRYHLPEGTGDDTNFLTVREMVGLVDYVTNSAQRDDMSLTY